MSTEGVGARSVPRPLLRSAAAQAQPGPEGEHDAVLPRERQGGAGSLRPCAAEVRRCADDSATADSEAEGEGLDWDVGDGRERRSQQLPARHRHRPHEIDVDLAAEGDDEVGQALGRDLTR